MSTQAEAEKIVEDVIRLGRAAVRTTEAADILLTFKPVWTERLLLRMVRALYQHRLRDIVALGHSNAVALDASGRKGSSDCASARVTVAQAWHGRLRAVVSISALSSSAKTRAPSA